MTRPGICCLAVAVLSLAGCAHSEKAPAAPAIDGGAVARSIVLCRTTEAELRRQLGEPTRDGRLHDSRVVSWITQWDSPTRYLAVLLDGRGGSHRRLLGRPDGDPVVPDRPVPGAVRATRT